MSILMEPEEIEEIEHDSHDVCSRCEGEGRLWADGKAHYPWEALPTVPCPNCDGTGRTLSGNEGRDVALAAARKVVEWIAECITEEEGGLEYSLFCNDWAALKQEVGL